MRGDIEAFGGAGISRSTKITVPDRAPTLELVGPHRGQPGPPLPPGDYESLHIAPEAAAFGGFAQPILHGLCIYGHCGQLLPGALCDGDAARFGALKLRFSSPVYPGETLRLVVWHDGPGRLIFKRWVGDKTVASNASFSYH